MKKTKITPYIIVLSILSAISGFGVITAHAAQKPPIIVEMFTSKNCPACPPADNILEDLSNRDGIITLGCHVMYWDSPEKKDPFARDFCDVRQHGYGGQSGDKRIYTPQMIVNGGKAFIGSRLNEVDSALKKARENPILNIPITMQNETVQIQVPELPQNTGKDYHLWAFFVNNAKTDPAIIGVNIGKWKGTKLSHEISIPDDPQITGIVVIAQENAYGAVEAAGKLDF